MPSLPTSKSLWTFSPQSIPGLSLWLDAADTVTVTGTSSVTAWKDKSGKGNNATNAGGDGPTYADNTMTFSEYNSRLYISIPYNYAISGGTIVFVGKPLSYSVWNQWRTLIRGANSDHQVILYYNNNNIGSYTQGNNFQQYGTYTNDGSFTMLMFVNISASSLLSASINGDIALSSNANPTLNTADTYYALGNYNEGSQPWGDLNEIIIYDSALSTVQRQQLEGYLAQKWELQENLPTTHPYYATSSMQLYKRRVFQRTFQPVDINGCVLWLDAADQQSLTLSGTDVTAWTDKSGNGNNGTATGTPTLSTAGGFSSSYKTIYLDGSSWFSGSVNISSTTSLTAFVVTSFALSSSTSSARVLGLASAGQADWNNALSCVPFYQDYGTSNLSTYRNGAYISVAVGQNTPVIGTCVYDGTLNYLYKNGASQIPVESTGEFGISIYGIGNQPVPSGELLNGYIGEVIVFNIGLTSSQRQQVESYLAWKWGLVTDLTIDHPGKLLPSFSTVFTPKSLTGLQLWLDAADSSTITGTSTVTVWADKSGNGNNGIPISSGPTLVQNVQNGLSGLTFPTTASIMLCGNILTGTNFSTLTVVKYTNSGVEQVALGEWKHQYGSNLFFSRNVSIYATVSTTTYSPFGPLTPADTTAFHMYSASLTSSTSSSSATLIAGTDGNVSTYTSTAGPNTAGSEMPFSVGGDYEYNTGYYPVTGYICEVIVYNSALTSSQRQQVEGYLAWKWGLQNNLPDTHAYKKFRP